MRKNCNSIENQVELIECEVRLKTRVLVTKHKQDDTALKCT